GCRAGYAGGDRSRAGNLLPRLGQLEESGEGLWLPRQLPHRGRADRGLSGGEQGSRRPAPAPAVRATLSAQFTRHSLPALRESGQGARAKPHAAASGAAAGTRRGSRSPAPQVQPAAQRHDLNAGGLPMRVNAVIAGVGMTPFGKHLDKSLKWLAGEAALAAVKDAGLELTDVQAVYVGNCAAGLVTGQESIRGQVALRGVGLGRVPIINIENACGSSATALNQACMMVSAGYYD